MRFILTLPVAGTVYGYQSVFKNGKLFLMVTGDMKYFCAVGKFHIQNHHTEAHGNIFVVHMAPCGAIFWGYFCVCTLSLASHSLLAQQVMTTCSKYTHE